MPADADLVSALLHAAGILPEPGQITELERTAAETAHVLPTRLNMLTCVVQVLCCLPPPARQQTAMQGHAR
jgi:hypothetical protein